MAYIPPLERVSASRKPIPTVWGAEQTRGIRAAPPASLSSTDLSFALSQHSSTSTILDRK